MRVEYVVSRSFRYSDVLRNGFHLGVAGAEEFFDRIWNLITKPTQFADNGESSDSKQQPAAGEPKPIRLRPSRNQKQRSILKQPAQPQETPPPPAPASPPPPPVTPSNDQGRLRRMRLKRSGQLREDLLLSDEPAPQKPDDVY